MGFMDILIPWLAIRQAGRGSFFAATNVSNLRVMGFPSRLRRGQWMPCAWFPLQPMKVCKYGWDAPIYIAYKGAVRAARIKRVEAYLNIEGDRSGVVEYRREYFMEVEGIKKEQKFEYMPVFAETAEDYAKGNINQFGGIVDTEEFSSEVILKACLGSSATIECYQLTTSYSFWRARRYKWDGIKAVAFNVRARNLITFDGKHLHMELEEFKPNTWPNVEACLSHRVKE